jgi:cytidylate kinase
MIVTIDGPAGAGKSTVARALAARLNYRFLDTGAMYRAVALAAVRRGIDGSDSQAMADLARDLDIRLDGDRVYLDGEDVSDAIRSHQITAVIRYAADNPLVRQQLVELQRRIGRSGDIVTEGRDQGSVVFPDAECKIFLTATPEERARRRVLDLRARGEDVSFEDVLADQNRRDQRDSSRAVGPLVRADDAVQVLTDGLTFEAVVERLVEIVSQQTRCPESL